MASYIKGIALSNFEGPIHDALESYGHRSNGAVEFDLLGATNLELTPKKGSTARSVTDLRHSGEVVGKLVVIAFAPLDGTGDEKVHKLDDINTGRYPKVAKVVPRSKTEAHSEVHLTIAAQHIGFPGADPALFAGNLELLGLQGNRLTLLGDLGQNPAQFNLAAFGIKAAEPTATLTVGYDQTTKDRFADPHAVFNPHERLVQVCGFLAISPELASQHAGVLDRLNAVQPSLTPTL